MDLEDEEHQYYFKLKSKGKSKIYLPKLEFLELKPRRRRQGKCVGAALEYCDFIENNPQMQASKKKENTTFISNDVWFHLANYIAPEDVQRYSLICSQSANSVNSCTFWLQMYRLYCQQTSSNNKWNLQLPDHLQMEYVKDCDRNTLRQRVIKALFYCHPPFKLRLQTPYTLENLVGRTYVSSWHKQVQCVWIMCYKFKLIFPLAKTCKQKFHYELENVREYATDCVVDDWECLAEEENNNLCNITNQHISSQSTTSTTNDLDGISLLVICCDRFIPFPSDIIYNHSTSPFRLAAGRELLSTDMRTNNLELDFISSTRDQTITVKYTKIKKLRVLPWWHPDFRIINKC